MVAIQDLISAAGEGDVNAVKAFLEGTQGSVLNQAGGSLKRTPLFEACENGHLEIVELLLDNGADINQQGFLIGQTALMVAARKGHADLVDLLLKRGADLSIKTFGGRTVFHIVAFYQDEVHLEVAKRLMLQMTRNLFEADEDGQRPSETEKEKGGLVTQYFKGVEEGLALSDRIEKLPAIRKSDSRSDDEDDSSDDDSDGDGSQSTLDEEDSKRTSLSASTKPVDQSERARRESEFLWCRMPDSLLRGTEDSDYEEEIIED